jgi:uncharacterized protein
MSIKLAFRAILLMVACLIVQIAQAEVKEYVRDYNYHGTDFDTRDTSRVNAIDGVKRELLEELGTYVGSVVKMNQDSLGNSYMSHDVINITAGIVAMKVLNEKWNQPEYFVKAGMKADPDDVLTKLKAMRADLELEKSLRDSHEELQRARNEMAQLKAQLAEMAQLKAQLAQMKLVQAEASGKPAPATVPAPVPVPQVAVPVKQAALAKPAPAPAPASINAQLAQVELAKDIAADKSVTVADAKPIAAPPKAQLAQVTVAAKPSSVPVPVINPVPAPAVQASPSPEEKMLVAKYVKAVQSVDVETAYQRALVASKKGDFATLIGEMSDLAEKGYARAQLRMGWIHERGLGVPQDYNKAREWYLKAQAGGDIDADAHLGRLYEFGWGVEKDYAKAADLYQRAVKDGSSAGYIRMGYLYETGKGVKLNWEKAIEYYRIAIDKGNFHGQARLGLMYQLGNGVIRDLYKASVLYNQAIDHGDPLAMTWLSMLHVRGAGGVSKDNDKAIALLREAIRYKLPATYAYMGFMYLNGYGVKQDYDEAKKYLEKGAENDAPFAEFILGQMYKSGRGVSQDQQKAKYWFDRAKSKGFDIASQVQ